MNDDEYGSLLLRPLAGEPAATAGVDVAKAMRDGGRMRRRRRWSGLSALVAAVTAALVTGGVVWSAAQRPKPVLPPDPPMPAACVVSRLPMGGFRSVEVIAGDSTGAWLVGNSDPVGSGKQRMLLWHRGALIAAAGVADKGIVMTDVNASGQAVGILGVPTHPAPYLYRDGKFVRLKGGDGSAEAINDAGMIAGEMGVVNHEVPVVWRSPGAEPDVLRLPPGEQLLRVRDIWPDGTVVGDTLSNTYLWTLDGTPHRITPPKIPGAAKTQVRPYGIAFGWIYAEVDYAVRMPASGRPPAGSRAGLYRYEPRSRTWQPLSPSQGTALAPTGKGANTTSMDSPAVWLGRKVLALPQVPGGAGSYLVAAVSDDALVLAGTSIGGHSDPSVPFQPIVWRCR